MTSSTVAPTFDPSRSSIHTCSPCSKGPRVITLIKRPSSVAGLSSTSTQIASAIPKFACKLRLSSIFGLCMNTRHQLHGENNRCSLWCQARPACTAIIDLQCLHQFARLRNVRFGFVTLQHAIKNPDNETVRQQDEDANQTGPMPKMPNLNWNQACGGENHQ